MPRFFKGLAVGIAILGLATLAACSPAGDASPTREPNPAVLPSTPSDVPLTPAMAVTGPEEVVFDWTFEACEMEDIPDLPARAFRDAEGLVHLVASHLLTRAGVGPDLNSVVHDCNIIMNSDHDSDPSHFNDNEWVAGVYTEDGETVWAVVHNEYHGWEHANCPGFETVTWGCWNNTLTLAVSRDGGLTFSDAAPPPAHLLASLPFRFEAGAGPDGMMGGSSILKAKDGYYYVISKIDYFKSEAQWACLLRTDDLSDPSSWRMWDGEGFNKAVIDPYTAGELSATEINEHVCAKLDQENIGNMHESLTYNEYLDRYVLIGISADNVGAGEVWGIYYSFSEDMVHWTRRQLLSDQQVLFTYEAGDEKPLLYPSLLDPESPSLSFDVSGETGYIYYTKFNLTNPLDRDLVRMPVAFFMSEEEAIAADTRTLLELKLDAVSSESATVNGSLATIGGRPLAGQDVTMLLTETEGPGGYYAYTLSGQIPPEANRVLMGYRMNSECDCSNQASEAWLYELSFVEGTDGPNLVPNPVFANRLSGANLWNNPGAATLEVSDREAGMMLHLQVREAEQAAGELASFGVTGGAAFTASFGARVPASSADTGLFVVIFLNSQGEIIRYVSPFTPPAIPAGTVTTDANGTFTFNWDGPTNNSVVTARFEGDEVYVGSEAEAGIEVP